MAKTRATCWAAILLNANLASKAITNEALQDGTSVLVAVTVEFNGVYGFSLLNVRDIIPTFTIGELAARRIRRF